MLPPVDKLFQYYGFKMFDKTSVLPKHTSFKVVYFVLAKFKNYTLFILFSVNFKNNFYRVKLSKRTTMFFIHNFFFRYLI